MEKQTDYSALVEVLACSSAASLHFAAGTILGFSAILIPQLESSSSDIKVTKEDISWITSVVPLVMPLGALVTGCMVDRIGRLNTIKAATVPYVLGWVCIATAQNLPMLLLGRFLTGMSLALLSNPAVLYMTEVARADFRGALVCLVPSLTSLGMVVTYAKGVLLHWRTISWLSISYCLFPILFINLWSPESPVWLISQDRTQDAFKSLKSLYSKDNGLAERQLTKLLQQRCEGKKQQGRNGFSLAKLWKDWTKPTSLKPLIILTTVFTLQQFSGIYIIIFYAVTFLKSVGTSLDPFISAVGIGIVRLVVGFITIFLMRNVGRRPLYMVSCTGMSISIFISGYFTKITEGDVEKSLVPLISILVYISVGVIGLMSIPWTMTAELFPLEIRGQAQGLITAVANLIMFATLKMYPFLEAAVGGAYAVQWVFAGFSMFAAIFIFIFLPETHGMELAEIEEYFTNNTIYFLRKESSKGKPITDQSQKEIIRLKDVVFA